MRERIKTRLEKYIDVSYSERSESMAKIVEFIVLKKLNFHCFIYYLSFISIFAGIELKL
jgi:hypothetical protein